MRSARVSLLKLLLDRHLTSFLALFLIGYLLFGVPQIYHIWSQLPLQSIRPVHWGQQLWISLGFCVLVPSIAIFYLSAWLMIPPSAVAVAPGGIGLLRWYLAYLALISHGLVAIANRLAARACLCVGVLILLAGGTNFVLRWHVSAQIDSSHFYPLAGSPCVVFGWLLVLTGIWFIAASINKFRNGGHAPLVEMFGRALTLVVLSTLVIEVTWMLAWLAPTVFSYRLYTIWSTFHLVFLILVVTALVDACHVYLHLPVRQLVLVVLLIILSFQLRPSTVVAPPPSTPAVQEIADCLTWYDQFDTRLDAIGDSGPVVFVAASGGGSRAALFTALVLEALRREPVTDSHGEPLCDAQGKPTDRSWADQIALISAVSGGSLASAYFIGKHPWGPPESAFANLRNSFESEIKHQLLRETQDVRRYYIRAWENAPDQPADHKTIFDIQPLIDELEAGPTTSSPSELRWMVYNPFVDDMCTDFMAPLLRGILTPGIERGTSLSRFWEQLFGWNGFDSRQTTLKDYSQTHPMLLLNATEARRGTRFVIGFPPLPPDALRVKSHPDDDRFLPSSSDSLLPSPSSGSRSLFDLGPEVNITLARAVRVSANFPWGVHTARIFYRTTDVRGDQDSRPSSR
jgi:hypothetical protein